MSTSWLFDEEMFTALVTGSLAVAALGVVEAISIARELARQGGQRIDVNQELVGQGVANIAAGAFSGYACSGSFTRSALSFQAGARSPFAGILTGLLVLASVMAFGPLAAYLPKAALAGMIFFVAYTMLDQRAIRRIFQTSRTETGIMVTTFVATLIVPLQFAVLAGVILSLAIYIYQSSMPVVQPVVPDENYRHFVERPDAPTCPQLAVVNIRGAIFFGAAGYVEDHLVQLYEENPGQRHLLLRMHGVHQCDLSGLEALEGIVSLYRESGGDIYLVQVRPNVRRLMETSGFEATLGKDRFLTQENAVDWLFEEILDPAVCCYEHHLSVIELVSALDRARGGATLIDVRELEEYRAGHLPGSQLIPLREIIDKAGRLPHDRPIYLICRSGRRSARAMHWFLDLGFTNVYNLGGGILSWKASGGPLEIS
jgi:SulP family sulfate permease